MGKTIEDIDINFRRAELDGRELIFADALAAPFALSGFAWHEQGKTLCRLPEEVLSQTRAGVRDLAWHTSGGMVRFRTDATVIAIRAQLRDPLDINMMPRNGSAGFDVYLGAGGEKTYFKSIMPDNGSYSVTGIVVSDLSPSIMRDWTVYLPIYSGIDKLEIGYAPNAGLKPPTPFALNKPLVFYGSSITQGSCASRTGNTYTSMLARWVDAPVINLGFSGNAYGEPALACAIAELEMSAFVLEYDHNAPDPQHLQATHEPFFRIIRERQPELPIIMLSKCDVNCDEQCRIRRNIIRQTWNNAVAHGDRNVYFIDGELLFGADNRDACTVDGWCHPNDLGFFRMAETIFPVLRQALTNASKNRG